LDGNPNSSDNQPQNSSQEETNQPPAKTKTKNFRRCSGGLTLWFWKGSDPFSGAVAIGQGDEW